MSTPSKASPLREAPVVGDSLLVRRRSFRALFEIVLQKCGIEFAGLTARQTPDGVHFARQRQDSLLADHPFAVSFSGVRSVRVLPGVLHIPGWLQGFVLEAEFLGVGTGFVCIRAMLNMPVWTVDDGLDNISNLAGWLSMEEGIEPRLAFEVGPEMEALDFSLTPPASEPLEISIPIAHVNSATGRVVQLIRGAVTVGFRRPGAGASIWPDVLIYDV